MEISTSKSGMAVIACGLCEVRVEFNAEDHPDEVACTHCYNRIQVE